ncbi:hypothetical protein [Sphingopyxis sp. NJF-3]
MDHFVLVIRHMARPEERCAIEAIDRDHALHLAELRAGNADLELWEADRLVAEMSIAAPHLWVIKASADRSLPGMSALRVDASGS